MRTVALPDGLYARLEALTLPLLPTVPDVVERLLDHYERTVASGRAANTRRKPDSVRSRARQQQRAALDQGTAVCSDGLVEGLEMLEDRAPRTRGATIELDGHTIRAASVSDMYKQALAYIVEHVPVERLQAIVPLPTSRQRYLIANEPEHPTGGDFVTAVRHGDYAMEAHKDYKNGVKHLAKLTQELGLNLRYLG